MLSSYKFPDPFHIDEPWKPAPSHAPPYPRTLRELTMIQLSGAIRNKPDWQNKRRDAVIVSKWREEAKAAAGPAMVTDEMFDYVLAELDWYDAEAAKHPPMQHAAVPGVYQADELIPRELVDALTHLSAPLERQQDWHPGSNQQVLDLIHPSLYPYVRGVTMLTDGTVEPVDGDEDEKEKVNVNSSKPSGVVGALISVATSWWNSKKKKQSQTKKKPKDPYSSAVFQWLPSDVAIDEKGECHFQSPINNVPATAEFAPLTAVLERILSHFVPLFNATLSDVLEPRPHRLKANPYSWYDYLGRAPAGADEDEWYDNRVAEQPAIPPFTPPPAHSLPVHLQGNNVQVIVKMANIVLTPAAPKYPGGAWHVEGMRNEQILATGICYYQSDNITESRLLFRSSVSACDYEQSDDRGVESVYGLRNEEALVQPLGSVETKSGRCLCFPNTLQHRVAPFELADPLRPGVRKILVFWLVNPNHRILSTASVDTQRSEVLEAALAAAFESVYPSAAAPFPSVLLPLISSYLPHVYDIEQAKRYREKLMQERKFIREETTRELFERPFSLCEH